MKCFNHPGADAVAVCKACGRALCHECIFEVGKSAGCRNRCEPDVKAIDELLQRGRTAYQKTSGAYFRTGVFVVLFGAAFIVGAILTREQSAVSYFLLAMGLLNVLFGISYFVSARRISQK